MRTHGPNRCREAQCPVAAWHRATKTSLPEPAGEDVEACMTHYDCHELKTKMASATNFSEIQDYFLSAFIERGSFLKMGRRLSERRSQFVFEAFGQAYREFGAEGILELKGQFIEVPELALVHGAFTVNGKQASVIYCADIEMGLFAVVENTKTGEMKYMRFTGHGPKRTPN